MMVLTNLLGDDPPTFLILLALIYFLCFVAQSTGRGGPAIFLVLVVAIIVPLLGILNRELANSILSILVTGILGGTLLMWLAHAVFPEPPSTRAAAAAPPTIQPPSYRRALANTAILLVVVAVCLINDQLAAALVIPITVASLLGQLDVTASGRVAIGLVIVNLFGGVLASIAYAILTATPEPVLDLPHHPRGGIDPWRARRCQFEGRQDVCWCYHDIPDPLRAWRVAAAGQRGGILRDPHRLCRRGVDLRAADRRDLVAANRQHEKATRMTNRSLAYDALPIWSALLRCTVLG